MMYGVGMERKPHHGDILRTLLLTKVYRILGMSLIFWSAKLRIKLDIVLYALNQVLKPQCVVWPTFEKPISFLLLLELHDFLSFMCVIISFISKLLYHVV